MGIKRSCFEFKDQGWDNYLDMDTHLKTWENPMWQPLVAPTVADEEMRLRYD